MIVRVAAETGRAQADAMHGQLRDSHGRIMRDLRVSVTDRCNFRCLYCLPETEEAANFYRTRYDAALEGSDFVTLLAARVPGGLNGADHSQIRTDWVKGEFRIASARSG